VWQVSRRSDQGRQLKQTISCAWFDQALRQWSVSKILSRPEQSTYNETPKIVRAADGTLWVCWSGRKDYDSPWKIYLCQCRNGVWSEPQVISSGGDHARAPVIAAGGNGELWVAWHEGTGAQMRVKVWYRPGTAKAL